MKRTLVTGALALAIVASARAQAVTAVGHVAITGGATPGTFDVTATRGGCSSGSVGKGSFGTQVSDSKVTTAALGSVQIAVPAPSATGSTQFEVLVRFGTLMKPGTEYDVNTLLTAKKQSGSGSVKVMDGGATAKVSFDVITAAGVHLVGSVDCKSVIRM